MTGTPEALLLLGGSGLVGTRFRQLARDRFAIEAPTRAALDVLDFDALAALVRASPARVLLNCVARTDVDGAEAERGDRDGTAYRANALLPRRLAEVCAEHGRHLVHLSTDYVFDGLKDEAPYIESDPPRPLSWYAQTKRDGEVGVLGAGGSASVLRIEMPFSARFDRKLDFPRLVASRLRAGTEVSAVDDQRITPVFVDDAVAAMARVAADRVPGVLHVAASTWTTPFDYAHLVARALGLDARLIRPERFERFVTTRPAQRPRHCWLDVGAFVRQVDAAILRPVEASVAAWAAALGG